MKKEEGATVAASPTFSAAKQCGLVSQGQNGPRFSTEILRERPIKYHKCPTNDTKRRRFLDIQTDWLSNSDEQIHEKKQ